jgi:hypothetical protein
MNVPSIFNAILHRVGRRLISDFGAPFVLETMDRIYHEINEELRCLEKTYTFDFSTVPDPSATPYMALPADWIYPLRVDPYKIFRDPTVFMYEEPNTCTFFNNQFHVAGVTAEDSFDVAYYGLGKILVNETDVEYAAQVAAYKLLYTNVPEWSPTHLHAFLIYATALELAESYPLRKQDEAKYSRLYTQLDRRNWLRTLAQPSEEGPHARLTDYTETTDPYAL